MSAVSTNAAATILPIAGQASQLQEGAARVEVSARAPHPLALPEQRRDFALEAGPSVRGVSAQPGHGDPAFTLRTYAHVLPEEGADLGFLAFGAGC